MTPAELIAREGLPGSYGRVVDRWWRPLAARLAGWRGTGRPLVVGVNGAQGSGKSTLCLFLEEVLLPELGLRAVTLALDDLYLGRAERAALAREVHPLLATRGVPGTHDATLGEALLDAFLAGAPGEVAMPRFSKAQDDRLPRGQWPLVSTAVDVVLFEGWCVGVPPEAKAALDVPVNALESEEDGAGRWRRHVNDQLAGRYASLFARIDRLVVLQPPGFASVLENRLLQERKLRAASPGSGMSDAQVRRFVLHYERLTRHMFDVLPARADLVIALDEAQQPVDA